jgi:uncharacterized membrane protein YbhN (UPF0104 family)
MNPLRQMIRHSAQWVPSILGIFLFGLSIWAIRQELRQQTLSELWHSVRAIPVELVGTAIALTVINYWTLTGYDTLATYYIRHPMPYHSILQFFAICRKILSWYTIARIGNVSQCSITVYQNLC